MYVFTAQQQVPLLVQVFRKLADRQTDLTELTIPGRNGPFKVREYSPRGKANAPVMLLVHGLIPDGRLDGGLNILAKKLSANGFRVYIPEIATERDGLMRKDALYDIGDAIHYARTLNGGPILTVGVSFGGGLLVRTAALPQYAADVQSVLCISGYNSLLRIGHFYIGDAVENPSGDRYTETPLPSGSLLMAYQYLDEFVTAKQLATARADTPKLIVASDRNDVAKKTSLLAEMPADLAARMLALGDPSNPVVHPEFEAMLDRHSEQNRFISPHENLRGLKAAIYILHGRVDSEIPVGEAEWNCKEVRENGASCYLEITPWLHHVSLDRQARLIDKMQVSYFVSRFLKSATT